MKYIIKSIISIIAVLGAINVQAQLVAPMNFALPPNALSYNITSAEYFIDTDPGLGNGTNIPITSGSDISANNIAIPISTLSNGVHRLYVRVKNTNGSWSISNFSNFFIIPSGAIFPPNATTATISSAEYFIDTDPGLGNGTNIPITSGSDISVNNIAIPISTLSNGVHRLYVRVKNTNGSWSISNYGNFFIIPSGTIFPPNATSANITSAEYFIDTDPGVGNGTSIPITPSSDISANNIAINIGSLSNGVHRVYVRTQNSGGVWSITNIANFYIVPVSFTIPPNATLGSITALEYFFDTNPGFGNGTMVTIPATTNLSNYSITADISNLQQDTNHVLYIRALDGWSQTTTTTFAIGTPTPINWLNFSGILQPNNSVKLNWLIASSNEINSFSIERSNDGKSFSSIGEIMSMNHLNNTPAYSFIDSNITQPIYYYRIKENEVDGSSSYSTIISIRTRSIKSNFYIINNPVHQFVRVHTGSSSGDILIYDINGSLKIKTPVTTKDIQQIDCSSLISGTYMIRLSYNSKAIKMVKE